MQWDCSIWADLDCTETTTTTTSLTPQHNIANSTYCHGDTPTQNKNVCIWLSALLKIASKFSSNHFALSWKCYNSECGPSFPMHSKWTGWSWLEYFLVIGIFLIRFDRDRCAFKYQIIEVSKTRYNKQNLPHNKHQRITTQLHPTRFPAIHCIHRQLYNQTTSLHIPTL